MLVVPELRVQLIQITHTYQNVQLQLTQLTVRNNDEVTAATRRVNEADIRQFTAQVTQTSRLIRLTLCTRELITQFIQEQRTKGLQHILLRGVVLTHLTASLRVTHRLEHRAENSRRNLRPITLRSRQQLLTERLRHRAAHLSRKRHSVRKHAAIHVLKARQILRSIRHSRSTRRLLIQQVKELIQALRQIRTLLVGVTNHPLKRV